MKTITQDFQNALKGIKQVDAVISYADRENTNFIITQNSEYLQTEAQDFLVTESAEVVIDNGGIQNCSIYWNTDLLKSCCKMLDLETSNAIPKGTELFVKIGLLVDDEYEYCDFGRFITTEDSEKKLDTGTYLTTAYDIMVRFSINVNENPLTFETGTTYTLKEYLEMICSKCSVPYSLGGLSFNLNAGIRFIDSDPYAGNKNVTYRDIVNDIAECLGTNFIINADGKFTFKDLSSTSVMTLDEQNLKDTNVNVGEKKNGIDGIQVYDGTTMLNYAGDDTSVFKIKNNNIMNKASSQLLNNVLARIENFSYYAFDINTFGVLALDPFDCFTVSANNTNYLLCALHNEIGANQGLGEQISYEFKDEDATIDYSTTSDKDITRNAYIEIDKANGQMVLKANSNGKIVKAELNASADEGTQFNVAADNITLTANDILNLIAGNSINLTSKNITINSTNFNVDKDGNMTCNNADVSNINIRSGKIELQGGTTLQPNFVIKDENSYTHVFGERINIKGNGGKCDLYTSGDPSINIENKNAESGTYPYTMAGMDVKEDGDGAGFFIGTYIDSSHNYGIYGSASSDYTALVVSNGTSSTVITPTRVTPGSLQESKKDFKKVENAIDIIKDIDIYKYHFKNESKDEKLHYGFVIGKDYKYSKEVTSIDENGKEIGADLYSFVSVCCQAIKEQQEQIEQLQKEIKSLKGDEK